MKIFLITIMAVFLEACDNNDHSSAGSYEGKDVSNEARITRDKNTRKTTLKVITDNKWKIYSGKHTKNINFSKPLLEGHGRGSFELNVPLSQRNYFQFVTNEGKAILAERHLPIQGGYNFRDLGGIKTKEGRFVKWGLVFRSDDLNGLTGNDLNYLSSIPIRSVVDFRSEKEIEKAPDKLPSTSSYYPYTLSPGTLPVPTNVDVSSLGILQSMDMDSLMQHINEQLVTDSASINRYKSFFRLLEDEKKIPLLFHCSAGKDRTGMAAALFLFALDVDEETILNDYLLSNKYIKEKYAQYTSKHPALEPLFSVKTSYLNAGLKRIKELYGSTGHYLDEILKVDRQKLKNIYLY